MPALVIKTIQRLLLMTQWIFSFMKCTTPWLPAQGVPQCMLGQHPASCNPEQDQWVQKMDG